METWEFARHQVAIAGRVTDAQTGKAIGGAQVDITAAPPTSISSMATKAREQRWAALAQRPARTRTADDGHFHFVDLPDGKYTLMASLPDCGSRYGTTAVKDIVVKRDGDGNITMATADITLPPTTLKGQITCKGAAAGVVMAEVRLKGSGERTFSDANGKYVLNGVQAGNRTVLVSLQGYQPASQTVKLPQPGAVETADFGLVASTA